MNNILEHFVNFTELDEGGGQTLHVIFSVGHLLGCGYPLIQTHAGTDNLQLAAIDHLLGDLFWCSAKTHGHHAACVAHDARLHHHGQAAGEASRIKSDCAAVTIGDLLNLGYNVLRLAVNGIIRAKCLAALQTGITDIAADDRLGTLQLAGLSDYGADGAGA